MKNIWEKRWMWWKNWSRQEEKDISVWSPPNTKLISSAKLRSNTSFHDCGLEVWSQLTHKHISGSFWNENTLFTLVQPVHFARKTGTSILLWMTIILFLILRPTCIVPVWTNVHVESMFKKNSFFEYNLLKFSLNIIVSMQYFIFLEISLLQIWIIHTVSNTFSNNVLACNWPKIC